MKEIGVVWDKMIIEIIQKVADNYYQDHVSVHIIQVWMLILYIYML